MTSGSLAGRRVLVTRAAHQLAQTREALVARGAEAVAMPTIEIRPVADLSPLIAALRAQPGWLVLTSKNAVDALGRALDEGAPLAIGWHVCAVGPATRDALEALGLCVEVMAKEHRAEGLLAELPGRLDGQRVVLPSARTTRDVLPVELERRGAKVERLVVYENVLPPPAVWQAGLDALRAGGVDAALLTSGSTARNLARLLGDQAAALLSSVVVAAIGPVAARDAEAAGLRVDLLPPVYTMEGLLDALEEHFAELTGRRGV